MREDSKVPKSKWSFWIYQMYLTYFPNGGLENFYNIQTKTDFSFDGFPRLNNYNGVYRAAPGLVKIDLPES